MSYFVKYDRTTGLFAGSGSCAPQDVAGQHAGDANIGVIEAAGDVQSWVPVEGGGVVSVINFDPVRALLNARVDAEAEAQRLRFITPGAGMAMTYLRKEAEARAFEADGSTSVPMIEAEAASTSKTVAAVAAEVIAAADLWLIVGAAIEGARLGAKAGIATAANLKDMDAAAVVDWAAVTSVEG